MVKRNNILGPFPIEKKLFFNKMVSVERWIVVDLFIQKYKSLHVLSMVCQSSFSYLHVEFVSCWLLTCLALIMIYLSCKHLRGMIFYFSFLLDSFPDKKVDVQHVLNLELP